MRRFKKCKMDGIEYGKKHIVFACVKKFIDEKNKDVTYDALKKIFYDKLQGSYGVLKNQTDYNNLSDQQRSDRYFKEVLETKYDKIYVCTEWGDDNSSGLGNIRPFIEHVNQVLNYKIEILELGGSTEKNLEQIKNTSKEVVNMSLNQILYGPPGTGKTYNTINKALKIIDSAVSENRDDAKRRFEELSNVGQIEFVTFHQSYGYEEFVEGIKANTNDGEISYDVDDGVFKNLSIKAERNYKNSQDSTKKKKEFEDVFREIILNKLDEKLKIETPRGYFYIVDINERTIFFEKANGSMSHSLSIKTLKKMYDTGENSLIKGGLSVYYEPLVQKLLENPFDENIIEDEKNYILIIDEINRGNISKIFGELITLIEPSKRIGAQEEIRLRLPYSNDLFGVPKNLYIIGTMNTADRSIALMDTALRRRFEFVEMMPDADLLDFEVAGVHLQSLLNKINARIEYLYDREHTIGHAYFMELNAESSLENLNAIMRNKIIPLLQEYFYDDWEKILLVLNDGFVQKNEMKASEIFDTAMNDEYIEDEKFLYSIRDTFALESYQRLCQKR